MPTCRGCNTEIVWMETVNKKKTPFDAKTEKRFVKTETGMKMVDTYINHFLTCSKAKDFKRK